MVPARLTVRNFLCYQESCPTIDFTGIQIACLTGENGNGKSALLDAMTWALWGQARARSDDELIHLGRSEMEVEFEFLAEDQCYRVIRKRKKGTQRSAGSTALEFHLSSPDGWKPLTANHVRETERRIRDVLKLDYETFVNSAFLLQGRADAFTVKTPGERKRILADILGLSRYDDLEKQARYETRLRDDQVRSLEREIADSQAILEAEPGYLAERTSISESLVDIEIDLATSTRMLEQLRQAEHLRSLLRAQSLQAEERFASAQRELEDARVRVEEHRRAREQHLALVDQSHEIAAGYQLLRQALDDEQSLGSRLQRQVDLERRRAALQSVIDRLRAELSGREQLLVAEVDRLRTNAEALTTLTETRFRLEQRFSVLDSDDLELQGLQRERRELQETVATLRSENAGLRVEMETIKRKQVELADATVCPLCQTDLGTDGQTHIIDAYEEEGRRLASRFREKRGQIEQSEARSATVEAETSALDLRLRSGRLELSRELGAIDQALTNAQTSSKQLTVVAESLEQIRAQLAGDSYAAASLAELALINGDISNLGYDGAAHQRVRATLEELRPFEGRQRDLELARTRLEGEQAALERSERQLEEWQSRLDEAAGELERARISLAEQPEAVEGLARAESRQNELLVHQRRLQQAIGAVEQKLDDCGRTRRALSAKTNALKAALEERHIYEKLSAAFSRSGIQALIIDHVIPEITDEANRLLERMTNNRVRVSIETQRQTLRGGVSETLDIRISDELGTRNYELFSGGEAFRINLALRIALSKLLARRAGAPLPTLVIDEGFGSQDAAALERLIEAINIIQSDFRCVLIITHLAELKDQFPVQIAVTKTAEGSIATVTS